MNHVEEGHFKTRTYVQWPKSTNRMASVEILRMCCCSVAGMSGDALRESVGYGQGAKDAGMGPNR